MASEARFGDGISRIDVSVDAGVQLVFCACGSDGDGLCAAGAWPGHDNDNHDYARGQYIDNDDYDLCGRGHEVARHRRPTRTGRSLHRRKRNTTRVDAQPARPKPSMTGRASDCGAQENLGLRRQGTPDLLRDVRRDVWQRCNRRSQIRVPHPQKVQGR